LLGLRTCIIILITLTLIIINPSNGTFTQHPQITNTTTISKQ